jgi:hypothetical protein
MRKKSRKISQNFDRGAKDGNCDLPIAEPDNPEYMRGYEEGLHLADIGIPYLEEYPIQPQRTALTAYIRKKTYKALKTKLSEGDRNLSELVDQLLSDWLKTV